jgi:hypothetical protein
VRTLILLGWRWRFRTLGLAITAVVVSMAPSLSERGWVLLLGGVALVLGTVAVCDALDLLAVYRDFIAWRQDRKEEERRIRERRQRRESQNLRLLP